MAATNRIKLQTNQLTMKSFFVPRSHLSLRVSYQCLQKNIFTNCLCLGSEQVTQKKSECSDLRSEIMELKSSMLQSEATPAQSEATPAQSEATPAQCEASPEQSETVPPMQCEDSSLQ